MSTINDQQGSTPRQEPVTIFVSLELRGRAHTGPNLTTPEPDNINLINHQPIQAKSTNADVIIYRSASTQADIRAKSICCVLMVAVVGAARRISANLENRGKDS